MLVGVWKPLQKYQSESTVSEKSIVTTIYIMPNQLRLIVTTICSNRLSEESSQRYAVIASAKDRHHDKIKIVTTIFMKQ